MKQFREVNALSALNFHQNSHEFGGWNAVVPLGAGAWDIYSDGLTEWASYDESTFVYEPVTGDFDKKVQVIYQDGSSEWARAGLIVRDVLNFGVDRATQSGGAAGRYQKCHEIATRRGAWTRGYKVWINVLLQFDRTTAPIGQNEIIQAADMQYGQIGGDGRFNIRSKEGAGLSWVLVFV